MLTGIWPLSSSPIASDGVAGAAGASGAADSVLTTVSSAFESPDGGELGLAQAARPISSAPMAGNSNRRLFKTLSSGSVRGLGRRYPWLARCIAAEPVSRPDSTKLGRAHVCTPVTNATPESRLLLA